LRHGSGLKCDVPLALILAHVAGILLDILERAESSFTADARGLTRIVVNSSHQPLWIAMASAHKA